MTEQEQALARRAIACKGWRWMPGMACTNRRVGPRGRVLEGGRRCPEVGKIITVHSFGPISDGGGISDIVAHPDILPDLTDPCTLGGLLALVREAWDDPHVYVHANGPSWYTVRSPNGAGGLLGPLPIDGSTEAEALVAALEAAP